MHIRRLYNIVTLALFSITISLLRGNMSDIRLASLSLVSKNNCNMLLIASSLINPSRVLNLKPENLSCTFKVVGLYKLVGLNICTYSIAYVIYTALVYLVGIVCSVVYLGFRFLLEPTVQIILYIL